MKLLITFFFLNCVLLSQSWEWQNPLPQSGHIYNSFRTNSGKLMFVGEAGLIVSTTDDGTSWKVNYDTTSDIDGRFSIYEVKFIDDNIGWLVGGHMGLPPTSHIMKTTDAGLTWQDQSPPMFVCLFDTYMYNADSGWVSGSGGYLLKTNNGGNNWDTVTLPSAITTFSLEFKDNIGFAAGGGVKPVIYRTSNYGITWDSVSLGSYNPEITFISDLKIIGNKVLAFSGRATVFESTNLGLTWASRVIDEDGNLNEADFIDNNNGIVVGSDGNILKTTDSGVTWIEEEESTYQNFTTVYHLNATTIYAAGRDGVIMKSTNSGDNWFTIQKGITENIESIKFFNKNFGYAIGYHGSFGKTTDAGRTWDFDLLLPSAVYLNKMFFTDSLYGWISGTENNKSIVLRTTNGGVSWDKSILPLLGANEINFVNRSTGWTLLGHPDSLALLLYKTTNGGVSWFNQPLNTPYNFSGMWFLDQNTGFLASTYDQDRVYPKVFKTTNGGTSWSMIDVDTIPNISLQKMMFSDNLHGWICGSGGSIFRTTDGGTTWSMRNSDQVSVQYLDINFSDPLNGWVVGENGVVLSTSDGGASWDLQDQLSTQGYYAVDFLDNFVWVGGHSGTILRYDKNPVGIEYEYFPVISNYELYQNYPNPFNPSTVVGFMLPVAGQVSLKVYDILGCEVATILNKELPAGKHQVTIDGRRLSSGVYFYSLEAGDFRQTKRMVLIK
jgi:photosystem II stability/assembly factor-like uncharacterized protein